MHLYSAHRSKTNTIKKTKPETLIWLYKLSLWEILAEKSFMHVYTTLFLKTAKNKEAFHVYIHVQRKTTVYNFLIQITFFIQLHIINWYIAMLPKCKRNSEERVCDVWIKCFYWIQRIWWRSDPPSPKKSVHGHYC